ncbi:hypothetical protein F5883DRAFT_674110 [Diaporthe sp. PMI_573]|nr:hypothetical protein F5883DRAFT_674110 [Diaporthaceae sp. PMI_573]
MQPENYQELPSSRQPSPPPAQTYGVQHGWNEPLKGLTPRHIASCVLDFFTPEILSRRKKQSGRAALLVCVFHLTVWTHGGIEYCYGAALPSGAPNNTPAAWSIAPDLPPARGRHADFVGALHSSDVRRPFRLLLPVVWSTLAVVVVSYLTGIPTSAMKREDSMLLQLVAWVRETGRYLYFFNDGYHAMNQHMWPLIVEMRGSMSLFYLTVAVPAAHMATFFAGMVTAELDLIASGSLQMHLPWDGLVQAVGKHSLMRVLVSHAVLVTSLYLGSSPSGSSVDSSRDEVLGQCRGWMTLEWLIPEAYPHGGDDPSWLCFWLFWAAWVFLLAVKEINWLKRALSYLGRVSFPLYLTHGPMIAFFSERLFYLTGVKKNMDEGAVSIFGYIENRWYDASWFPFNDQGPFGLEPNYLFCLVLSIAVFLYMAELGVKSIETPSVRFSRWVYDRYFNES